MLKPFLRRLGGGHALTQAEAAEAMGLIMAGEATAAQIGAFAMALRVRGETVEEIAGCAMAMRACAAGISVESPHLIDTCGTGGDGASTFNISTAVAFVAAAGGAMVAKHGNRAVSSHCGSADVMEALGARLDLGPSAVTECLTRSGSGSCSRRTTMRRCATRPRHAAKSACGLSSDPGLVTILLGPAASCSASSTLT